MHSDGKMYDGAWHNSKKHGYGCQLDNKEEY